MKMLFDNVLIKEKKEEGSVVVAGDGSKKAIGKGTVISVGPGQAYGLPVHEPCTVVSGSVVYFLKDVAYKVEVRGEEHWIVRERDILGILGQED